MFVCDTHDYVHKYVCVRECVLGGWVFASAASFQRELKKHLFSKKVKNQAPRKLSHLKARSGRRGEK